MKLKTDLIVSSGLSPHATTAADAYRLAQSNEPSAGSDAPKRPLLRVYSLERPSILVGRYQSIPELHRVGTEEGEVPPVGRRLTGGRAVPAGPGFAGISLILPRAWELTGNNPQRMISPEIVANRYSRAIMTAFLRFGVKVTYLGRDALTAGKEKIGLVGFTFAESGAVLFESHLATGGDLAGLEDTPIPGSVAWQPLLPDPPTTSLHAQLGDDVGLRELADAVAIGAESKLGFSIIERDWTAEELQGITRIGGEWKRDDRWMGDRRPRPEENLRVETGIQLGRFSVALALRQDGRIASVTLAGDFLSEDRTVSELEESFQGLPLDWNTLASATDQVLNQPGRFLLGMSQRRTLPDTLMQAAAT